MLRDTSMPWLVQQSLIAHRPLDRPLAQPPNDDFLASHPAVHGRTVCDGAAPDHAVVDVDTDDQTVGYRMPGAIVPYASWTMHDFLGMSRRELEEFYL